jgi:1-deoxy-D-xylulose-5-phosphate reductoisomerase
MKKQVALLGSTGSIGRQALEVIRKFPENLKVTALAAGSNVDLLVEQAEIFQPRYLVIGDPARYSELLARVPAGRFTVLAGTDGLTAISSLPEVDLVLTAVVGAVGIRPTLAALQAGKRIALANKETLVTAGALIMATAAERGGEIIPVDSEHSAIFQCLEGRPPEQIARLVLTASGGPFRAYQPEQLAQVTLAQALNHPTWRMGGKITIDSATMFNKGLEIIEAHWLFGMDYDRIDVVIHPESTVHSLVELTDGSFLAQLGRCDMRLPIQLALTYPERWEHSFPKFGFYDRLTLHFEPVNLTLFPALELAYTAGRQGGSLPAALNAANEIAVGAFLANQIGFTQIARIVSTVMGYHQKESFAVCPDLEEILAVDAWARAAALNLVTKGVDFEF